MSTFGDLLTQAGIPWEDVSADTRPWLYAARPTVRPPLGVGQPIFGRRLITVHATRGGSRDAFTEYSATKNWMKSNNNRQAGNWGGSCQIVVGPVKIALIHSGDLMSTYGAGYGGAGRSTWPVDAFSWNLEMCQPSYGAAIHPGVLDLAIRTTAVLCRMDSIPIVKLWIPDQSIWPPPSGITGHAITENGIKTGKSDGGNDWPWTQYLAGVERLAGAVAPEEDIVNDQDIEKIAQKVKAAIDPGFIFAAKGPYVYVVIDSERSVHAVSPDVYLGGGGEWEDIKTLDPNNPDHKAILRLAVTYPRGIPPELGGVPWTDS